MILIDGSPLSTIVGEVVEGFDVVKEIEARGTASGKPNANIKIAKSGTV
jgi:cyclophilin family peptidyl-prolyl cis-trans isomerase